MAVPSSNIDFSDLQTEFGGSSPISLTEYYRGGSYVPNTVTNAAVPTSGVISLSQFAGTSADGGTAVECLDNFWTYRANYFRSWWTTTGYPGDIQQVNNPYTQGTVSTITPTFNGSANPSVSGITTMVYMFFGFGSSSFVTTTSTPAGYEDAYTYTADPLGLALRYVQATPANMTGATFSWSRASGNRGSWSAVAALPGKWAVASNTTNYAGGSRTLPSGRVSILLAEQGGYDASSLVSYSGANNIRASYWWYNTGSYTFAVNNTANPITESHSGQFSAGRNNLFELYRV
jgi:hypothetical protein